MREIIHRGDSVIVSDIHEGKAILKSEVSSYEVGSKVIFVPIAGQSEKIEKNAKYHIKVMVDGNLVEYDATVRNIGKTEVEFALYHKKVGYGRAFERHAIQANGSVTAVSLGGVKIKLRCSIPIEVLDISGGGILFRAHRNEFRVGSILRAEIELMANNKIISEFKILRTQNLTESHEEYGCKNMAVKGKEDCLMELAETREYDAILGDDRSFLEEYLKKVASVEEKTGYTKLLGMYKDEGISEKEITENILEFVTHASEKKVENMIHRMRPEEEKEARHRINTAILNGILGMELHRKEEEVKQLIRYGLGKIESSDGNPVYEQLTSVSEEYDTGVSFPENGFAMIPLAYMEQLYFVEEEKAETQKHLQYLLAEYFRNQLNGKDVLLVNGKRARICGLYASDISHPVLYVDGKLEQLKNSRGIVGTL